MPNQNYPAVPEFPPAPNATPPVSPTPRLPGSLQQPLTLKNLIGTNLLGWGMVIDVDIDRGLSFSPVAGPPGLLTQFWRAHAGLAVKLVSCTAIAGGTTNPQMPYLFPSAINPGTTQNFDQPGNPNAIGGDAFQADNNPVWTNCRIVTFSPENFMDGVQCRGCMAIYTFVYQLGPTFGVDSFDFGASPFDITPAASNVLNPQDFYKYLHQVSPVSAYLSQYGSGTPIGF